jgi:hypothetical protein
VTRIISPVVRRRLAIQGFVGLDDAGLCEVERWLRFTPALCTTLIAAGTALAFPPLLWAMAPIAALGAVYPRHPFDVVYNLTLRRLTGTRPLPPNGAPRRFACGLAAVWVAATALYFAVGVAPLGYALGGMLVLVGAIVSSTHFCIPSLVFRFLTGTLRATPP